MPWKNGGGETLEIAVGPSGAPLDAFEWRVSQAHVASSGPFSLFAGVDRTLAVLGGRGIRLSLAGRGTVTLGSNAPPFAFPADVTAEAELIDGAIDDLNVMTRRGSRRHRLSRLRAAAPVNLERQGDILLVLIREAAATVRTSAEERTVAAGDTVMLDRPDEARVEIAAAAAAQLYVIDLWRS
jgi:uncharacterized protein